MTYKEARTIIETENPNVKIVKCYEYDTVFVFQVVPIDFDMSIDTKNLLDSTLSVDKRSGAVRDFKPFHIPISEYRSGKEVII